MFIYNLVVLLYGLVIRIAAIKKIKAKQWVEGRKNWRVLYSQKIKALHSNNIVWVHCASYGEFEQGRPLIEKIRSIHPQTKIVLSFFSPSGYEQVKNWQGADFICYLPLDTRKNAEDFISMLSPKAAIFIKYEFWLNFLNTLKKHSVKTYLVSAVFKGHHPFFKWYGGIFRKSLQTFDKLFIQDQASAKLLESIGINNNEVAGDTRFDRVLEVKSKFQPIPLVEEFCSTGRIIVAGSTWQEDEAMLVSCIKKLPSDVKLIIAPHEISQASTSKLIKLLQDQAISFSLYSLGKVDPHCRVLVVDTFGLLSKLYWYCNVAYIGGGFGDGIHNCLEAAVYLKPVVFYGDTHHKYNEAVELINLGAAKNVLSETEAIKAFDFYLEAGHKNALEKNLQDYFALKSGTTEKVMQLLNLA